MPLKVTVVAVLLTELRFVTPVALTRFNVASEVTVALTISIPVIVMGVRLAISVAVMVSIPAAPTRASLACHVWAPETSEASNESALEPPVTVFTPVVSDLSHALDKSLILNSLLRIFRDLFLITYDAPTVTKIIVKLKVPKAEVLSGLS